MGQALGWLSGDVGPLPALSSGSCVLKVELIYYTFGQQTFPSATTANLERVMRRFNELQYWIATELCLCAEPGKRAQLLRKFIKLAAQ